MLAPKPAARRLDAPTLEMIVVVMLITLQNSCCLMSCPCRWPFGAARSPSCAPWTW